MSHTTILLLWALLASALPISLPLAARQTMRHTARRLRQRSPGSGHLSLGEPYASARPALAQALRLSLAAGLAELFVVLASAVAYYHWHLAPAITAWQIVAIDLLALSLPLATLSHDHTLSLPQHHAHKRLIERSSLIGLVGFSVIASTLTYLNYLFFFVRHNLSAAHLDPALPLYHQATTVTFVSLALCLLAYVLFDHADVAPNFLGNRRLVWTLAASLLLLLVVAHTQSLSVLDWLSVLLTALLYTSFRLLQRHTRQHTRRAVADLHRQVRSVKS